MYVAAEQSFWQQHGDEISAGITMLVAILIAIVVDRLLLGRAVRAAVRMATGVLSSTAVLGIILGFAGRQVIANLVSGVLIAFTQPIRIGDLVTIGDEVHGRVVDIALTYTRVDAGDGSLIVVPNEKVMTDVVLNHSAGNSAAPVTVDVWLRPDADVEAAREELEKGEVTS